MFRILVGQIQSNYYASQGLMTVFYSEIFA